MAKGNLLKWIDNTIARLKAEAEENDWRTTWEGNERDTSTIIAVLKTVRKRLEDE